MKTYAFIDSQNVHITIRKLGWELDWRRFFVYLKDKYKVDKAFIFIGLVAGNTELYHYLQGAGYELIFRDTIPVKDSKPKGNVDAELVLHASAIEYPNYDKAIIVSGDGDFACLINFLVERNKLEQILVPDENSYSSLLKKFSKPEKNYITFINRSKKKLAK